MKNLIITLTLLITSVGISYSQSTYPKPEFLDIIYYINGEGGLTKLEKQLAKAEITSKGGAFSVAKTMVNLIIPNSTSSVQIIDANPKFIIEFSASDVDIQGRIKLVKATPTRKRRVMEINYSNAISPNNKSKKNEQFDLNFKSAGPNTFMFSPDKDLSPGEYVVILSLQNGGLVINPVLDLPTFSFTVK